MELNNPYYLILNFLLIIQKKGKPFYRIYILHATGSEDRAFKCRDSIKERVTLRKNGCRENIHYEFLSARQPQSKYGGVIFVSTFVKYSDPNIRVNFAKYIYISKRQWRFLSFVSWSYIFSLFLYKRLTILCSAQGG